MKLSPKVVMGGLAVYFSMAAGTYIYLRSTKPPPQRGCPHHPKQDEEEEVFDRIAGKLHVVGRLAEHRWGPRRCEVLHGGGAAGRWAKACWLVRKAQWLTGSWPTGTVHLPLQMSTTPRLALTRR